MTFKLELMEQLNKIEIRGYVGSVTLHHGSEREMARFTVATSTAYRDREGGAVIDTTWHNVIAWEGKGMPDLDKIQKGGKIQVVGRIRNQKYVGVDGIERTSYDILASKVNIIESDEPFQYEM